MIARPSGGNIGPALVQVIDGTVAGNDLEKRASIKVNFRVEECLTARSAIMHDDANCDRDAPEYNHSNAL